ncbi:MAG TPA: MarR family transcriptional regulator [Aggregatilineales bacterium]|nr:MarR family transcriptional regulator [Aggregatilineales bacterium]
MNEETLILLRYLIKSGRLAETSMDSLLSEAELSATKLLTLRQLDQAERRLSLGQLATCMAFAKSNATQLVDSLESAHLVKRVPNEDDRRCTGLDLTEEGRKRYEAALRTVQPLVEQLEALYSPDERRQLAALLQRLSDALK